MMAKANAPINKRKTNKEKGGITSKTTLLTTYIPPQMDAAVNPAIKPANDLCFCIAPDYNESTKPKPDMWRTLFRAFGFMGVILTKGDENLVQE